MPLDLSRLKAIAEAATPGPWTAVTRERMRTAQSLQELREGKEVLVGSEAHGRLFEAIVNGFHSEEANAAHIAAFSPSVALEILERLERAEQACRDALATLDAHGLSAVAEMLRKRMGG